MVFQLETRADFYLWVEILQELTLITMKKWQRWKSRGVGEQVIVHLQAFLWSLISDKKRILSFELQKINRTDFYCPEE